MSESLFEQIRRINRLKAQNIGGAALSLPGAVASARRGGPMAARRYVQDRQPQGREAPSQMDIIEAKQSILSDMATAMRNRNSAAVSLTDKLAKQSILSDKLLGIFEKFVAGNIDASQALAKARIDITNDMNKQYTDALMDVARSQVSRGGNSGAGYRKAREIMQGVDNEGFVFGPQTVALLANEIFTDQTMGPQEQAEAWSMLKAEAAQRGEDLHGKLLQAAEAGDQNALMASQALVGLEDRIASVEEVAMQALAERQEAVFEGIMRQGAGMSADNLVQAYKTFSQGVLGASPEGQGQVLDQVFSQLQPEEGGPDLMENYQKLLDQLDQPEESIPSHYLEARRMLFQDDEFKSAMAEAGFQHAPTFLRHLRGQMRQQNRDARRHDRDLMRQLRDGRTPTAPEPAQGGPAPTPVDLTKRFGGAELGPIDTSSLATGGADLAEMIRKQEAAGLSGKISPNNLEEFQAIKSASSPMEAAFPVDEDDLMIDFDMDLSQPHIVYDQDDEEFMQWNPETQGFDVSGPGVENAAAQIEQLFELDPEKAMETLSQMRRAGRSLKRRSQRAGADKVKGRM